MPGAIAGTAIFNTRGTTKNLHTITLTINNSCNLNCPHCYLQYRSTQKILSKETIDSIFSSEFEHLAIVGKEPLVNTESIQLLEHLIIIAKETNKTVSIVTNGVNLKKIHPDYLALIDYIDISFDGGPLTYSNYRKGNFAKIIEGVEYILKAGAKQVNALHTINDQTLLHIDDMLSIQYYGDFQKIMFSPYIVTENFGSNFVSSISISEILEHFANSELFRKTEQAFVFLDFYHLKCDGEDISTIESKILDLDLATSKIRVISIDPLHYGIIRVTYDDLVLTPYQSTHPLKYLANTIATASHSNLNKVYHDFLTTEFFTK